MREYLRQLLLCTGLFFLLAAQTSFAENKVIVLQLDGAIGPATQDYVKRGLAIAREKNATAVILQMNTPGGLESATRGINEAILASTVPVITYVSPPGARAASAGTFIMYASHLAAMAPGTNVGAATPINLMDSKTGQSSPQQMTSSEKKVMNDATAYIQSLAELRNRNPDFAALAVKKAASISADEAKRQQVINIIADNYPQLLQKLDGQKMLVDGKPVILSTKNTSLETITPDWRFRFLSFITNPNIAYILMLIAIYGLFFELSSPGLILPGVAGLIALLLVLYAFQLMPVNYVGLTLLLIGIAFMVFEVFISSFGVLGIGGVLAFIVGSIMLFDTNDPQFKLALPLIIGMSLVSSVFFLMVLSLAMRAYKRAIITGQEALIGANGVVITTDSGQIAVRVLGEIWEAVSNDSLQSGDKVKVVRVKGLVLTVEPHGKRTKKGES